MPALGSTDDAQARLRRHLIQRLEDLRRAGLDRIPNVSPAAPIEWKQILEAESTIVAPTPEPVLAINAEESSMTTLFSGADELGEPTPAVDRLATLQVLSRSVAACTLCPALASSRTNTVFGEGSPTARLMF